MRRPQHALKMEYYLSQHSRVIKVMVEVPLGYGLVCLDEQFRLDEE